MLDKYSGYTVDTHQKKLIEEKEEEIISFLEYYVKHDEKFDLDDFHEVFSQFTSKGSIKF